MAKLVPDNNNLFINPYNFVPLTSKVERTQAGAGEEGRNLTGYISCTIKVADMLALPDRNAEDKNSPRCFDFYKINGKPVIPGSEIRGCIRSVYEAVTQSCLSVINNNVLTSRLARPESDINPGILRFEGENWVIYPAIKRNQKGKDKTPVSPDIEREWHKFTNKPEFSKSYFYFDSDKPAYICTFEDVANFEELIEIFIENNSTDKRFCGILKKMRRAIAEKTDVAVFYRVKNEKLSYFSPAQISRQMFNNTVSKLLGEHANICSEKNGYCPACRLFGTIGADKPKLHPIASKLRFSDAVGGNNVVISNTYLNLPELSAPKITSVEFYSHKGTVLTDTRRWNYDTAQVTLNGRKFYYHSRPRWESKLGDRSLATKPVCKGSEFSFRVYFDKINNDELEKFLWVLTIGENNPDSKLMHKIGYGRPVGYGSIKITVDEIVERCVESGKYSLVKRDFTDYNVSDSIFAETDALEKFKLIATYDYVLDEKISYPLADDGRGGRNSKAAHNWFSNNRLQNNTFRFVLPRLTPNPEDLRLPAMVADGAEDSGNKFGSQPKAASKPNSNSNGRIFDFDKFVMNNEYSATVIWKSDKTGRIVVEIEILGERARIFPNDRILSQYNFEAGDKVRVIFKGKNIKNPQFPYFIVV